MRFRPGAGYRDRLLDAMAWLLVDLHRGGVYWGDCSLANTLFRRDGDRIQAYLVDAETSEVAPDPLGRPARLRPRDPRRERRLRSRRPRRLPGPRRRTSTMRSRPPQRSARATRRSGASSTTSRSWSRATGRRSAPGCAGSTSSASRWTRSSSVPGAHGAVRLRTSRHDAAASTRSELERLTGHPRARGPGAAAAQRPRASTAPGSSCYERRPIPRARPRERWLREVYEPTLARAAARRRPDRDLVQAYCDVLEHKWLLSERPGATSASRPRSSPTSPRVRPRRSAGTATRADSPTWQDGGGWTRSTSSLPRSRRTTEPSPPSARGARARPSGRRPPARWRAGQAPPGRPGSRTRGRSRSAGPVGIAEHLPGHGRARRRSPGSCRSPSSQPTSIILGRRAAQVPQDQRERRAGP